MTILSSQTVKVKFSLSSESYITYFTLFISMFHMDWIWLQMTIICFLLMLEYVKGSEKPWPCAIELEVVRSCPCSYPIRSRMSPIRKLIWFSLPFTYTYVFYSRFRIYFVFIICAFLDTVAGHIKNSFCPLLLLYAVYKLRHCCVFVSGGEEMKSIQVSTVDAFQGGEKAIIILSCVRTQSVDFIASDKYVHPTTAIVRWRWLISSHAF